MKFPITVRVNGSTFDLFFDMGGVIKRIGNIELMTAQVDKEGNCYPVGQYPDLGLEQKIIAVASVKDPDKNEPTN